MQGVKFKPKEDKAKHGLKIRPKISIFCMGRLRHYGGQKEKERREEEKKKKIQVWNFSMEFMFGTSLLFRTLIYVSMEPMYGFIG